MLRLFTDTHYIQQHRGKLSPGNLNVILSHWERCATAPEILPCKQRQAVPLTPFPRPETRQEQPQVTLLTHTAHQCRQLSVPVVIIFQKQPHHSSGNLCNSCLKSLCTNSHGSESCEPSM